MSGELLKSLSLFEGSDFVFISYGEEREGEYVPHAKALRIEPELELLEEAINKTPLLPNDFGIMPFKWKARSEEDKTYMLVERKLSRWSEGELFTHGYLIIDRILLDIDVGELSEGSALKLALRLKEKGIGKVAYTGGGLLAVVELSGSIEVRERESFRRIKENLLRGLRKIVKEFDPHSLNPGKGVRLVGTRSRKRGVDTKWILWEEGKKFDLFELLFGIEEGVIKQAPKEVKERIKERFGIGVRGDLRKATPEEVFARASEFYGELDGRRNDFMLSLAGEMLSAGVEKERVIELYYEHLAGLERKDRPSTRIKQTIEWVYREGKEYRLKEGEYPKELVSLVRSLRGEEVSLSWEEWVRRVKEPLVLERFLDILGFKLFKDGEGFFFFEGGLLYGELLCEYVIEREGEEGERAEVRKKGKLPLCIYFMLPPCLVESLHRLIETENGETEWLIRNLLQVSFLLPSDMWEVRGKERVESLIDNPLVEAIKLIVQSKGLSKEEVRVGAVKRVIGKEDTGFGLVRCMNPLLKRYCSEGCSCYKFRSSLPHLLFKEVDRKTGSVQRAVVSIDGEEIEISGKVLENYKTFASYLEKRGVFLSSLVKEWLYQDIMKAGEVRYVDEERDRFLAGLCEVLANFPTRYHLRIKDGHVWIQGSDFLEILQLLGQSIWKANVKRIKEEYGLKDKRTSHARYTLIPLSLLDQDTVSSIMDYLVWEASEMASMEDIETEERREVSEEDLKDEDYVLGRKLYAVPSDKGVEIHFMGEKKLFTEFDTLREWLKKIRSQKDASTLDNLEEEDDVEL